MALFLVTLCSSTKPSNFDTVFKVGHHSGKSSDIFQSKCKKLINFVSKGRKETKTTKVLYRIVLLRAKSHRSHITVKTLEL